MTIQESHMIRWYDTYYTYVVPWHVQICKNLLDLSVVQEQQFYPRKIRDLHFLGLWCGQSIIVRFLFNCLHIADLVWNTFQSCYVFGRYSGYLVTFCSRSNRIKRAWSWSNYNFPSDRGPNPKAKTFSFHFFPLQETTTTADHCCPLPLAHLPIGLSQFFPRLCMYLWHANLLKPAM